MTLAPPDPSRVTTSDDSQDEVPAHAYAWYDPDAAAFGLDDPLADLEPDDEDVADYDWR
jgi:hypothetical protein